MGDAQPLNVVGIGASAGGLSALTRLIAAVPAGSGCAFVVLQHQAESQVGTLAAHLKSISSIPVVDAVDGMQLVREHVFVVPPHAVASVAGEALGLEVSRASPHKPIDALFRSLCALGARAAGIVLSGTGDDGTEGLRALRAAGGLTAVQDPTTAEFDEMPRSALSAGVVDVVLPAERLGAEIATLRKKPRPDAVETILAQLRDLAGIDFSSYKRSTIERRLERQLARHHFATVDAYAAYLAQHPKEARALYEDLLVHVTEFFRDRDMLELVCERALPELLAAKSPGAPLRVWIPGCSTGEEAYSLAILLLENLAARGDTRPIQLFGTDLSARAIEIARTGHFPEGIEQQVSPERLATYFVRDGAGWRVTPAVRQRCVFVRHDLTTDPPFSRVDLVSCRNLLIYLGANLQKRVIELFYYALEQPGFLLVGRAEAIAGHDALFGVVETGLPLYSRKSHATRPPLAFSVRPTIVPRRNEIVQTAAELYRRADHVMLARYAPPSVLVDENFDIVQFRGRTGAFLEPVPGHPQTNVFKMAREGLAPDLRTATIRAQRDGVPVRVEGLTITDGDTPRHLDLEVLPIHSGATPTHFLIVFEDRPAPTPSARSPRTDGVAIVDQLQHELAATREYLATVVAQHLSTTDELGVVNEELQSANEELQSANEELQTAGEELQSTNDELSSVNEQLARGNAELRQLNDDLLNILDSIELAIIIVDTNLDVRRFTPSARGLFKLIEGDIGRPIGDLRPSFAIADLGDVLRRVIHAGVPHEREITTADGHHHRMQVRPYRTSDQLVGGAVLTFVDVTLLRDSIEAARRAREAEQVALESMAREKAAFLNAVSHELRTPLNAILLWTAVVRDLAGDRPEIMRAVATIEASARAETQLVDDLLDVALSRTSGEALLVSILDFEPCPAIEETIGALSAQASEKRIEIDVDLDRTARVAADPRRLRQIVWHLVSNAIKFTPPGGRVAVRLRRDDSVIELAVNDTGKGLRPDQQTRVFEPFSQEDLSATREHSGLGIGLAFVRHLVERQAGTIAVASAGDGKGATFTVRLPAA